MGEVVSDVEAAGADWIHFDVMDGRFVPNLTFGPILLESVRSESDLPFDCHMMIVEPERYVPDFIKAGADIISVHAEAVVHLHAVVGQIKECGAKASVAINPGTAVDVIEPVLRDLDMVVVMSVNPGFAGQQFLPHSLQKLAWLSDLKTERGLSFDLEIDGGMTVETVPAAVRSGATVVVSASSIFVGDRPVAHTVAALREAICVATTP